MASRKRSISRSVACSLAALLLLSGCMFMVSTFQSDSEEWVLVEDQVFDEFGVFSVTNSTTDAAEVVFAFDEETATYELDISGGSKQNSSSNAFVSISTLECFDFSKNYKITVSSALPINSFSYYDGVNYRKVLDLANVTSDDEGVYTASVVLLDQLVTDLEFQKYCYFSFNEGTSSSTFAENSISVQVYELQTDNTGSIAAGITGLIMIVCGVFAMPMHNILRRR